jgi:predicted Fe-S protein YdhL (DUF1289 family)
MSVITVAVLSMAVSEKKVQLRKVTESGRVHSPCIGVCKIDHVTGECQGCCRTITEIAGWSRFTSEQRSAVLKRIGFGPD